MDLMVNDYLPLRDVVFHTLREGILRGELKPGERLIEVTLAQKLGVSRTPIREAIHKLEQEGLVNMVPRRGAQVASISEKNVHDVLEVRKALEQLAAELAIERITSQEKVKLRQAELDFAAVAEGKKLALIAQRDEIFHDIIYAATKNQKLQFVINNLREQMYRFRLEYIKEEKTRKLLMEEHRQITDAIFKGDAELAKKIMAEHIENQEKTILRNLVTI